MSEEDLIANFEALLRHLNDDGINTERVLNILVEKLEEVENYL